MIPLLVLELNNIQFITNTLLLLISIVTFIFAYRKVIKNTVEMADLNRVEKRLSDEDKRIEHKVDRMEDHLREDVKELKDGQLAIMKILMEIRNIK